MDQGKFMKLSTLLVVLAMGTNSALANNTNFSLGLGFSYSKGNGQGYYPAYGMPIYGYGAGANSFGAIGVCANSLYSQGYHSNGLFGPGAMMPMAPVAPMMPMLPPPAPLIPPHVALGGYGMGMVQQSCIPCGAGMIAQPIYSVPGGPVVSQASSFNAASSGIIDLGPKNEWEKNDTADIVWAAALGMGMQATNVQPVAFPRQSPTLIDPTWFNTGNREVGFTPRPTPFH